MRLPGGRKQAELGNGLAESPSKLAEAQTASQVPGKLELNKIKLNMLFYGDLWMVFEDK